MRKLGFGRTGLRHDQSARRSAAGLAVLIGLLVASAASATDLNAPVTDHPTIGSEIVRGQSAALDCLSAQAPSDYSRCISAIADDQAARRPNVDAFKLGLFFAAWQSEDIHYQVALRHPDWPEAQEVGPQWFRYAQIDWPLLAYYEKRLGITEEQLLSAVQAGPETRKRLAYWNAGPSYGPLELASGPSIAAWRAPCQGRLCP